MARLWLINWQETRRDGRAIRRRSRLTRVGRAVIVVTLDQPGSVAAKDDGDDVDDDDRRGLYIISR